MSNYSTENLRTVALVGHGGAGKTSLIEAMLMRTGAIAECGSIEKGTTVCDNDPQEKAVGHSLRTAVVHLDTAMPDLTPVRVHVIDTPGYPDYVGQALSALDAVKNVVVVIDAAKGIELMTRRMMKWAGRGGHCRMIVINKIDAEGVDLPKLLSELKEAFGDGVLPINLPAKGMTRVIDCFDRDTGESDIMTVSDVHRAFIERVVEVDDATMEKYLEEGDADPSTLHAPITKALREGHIIPVCFTSAKNLIGIRDLIKVIIRHMPAPVEANAAPFVDAQGNPVHIAPDPDQPVIARVFKVVSDPFVGKIGVFRVHRGRIKAGTELYAGDAKKPFKVVHPLLLQGKNTADTDELHAGDIGALSKVDDLYYGCVLHSDPADAGIVLPRPPYPRPMFGLAIEPARRGDESRMGEVLQKMLAEDPTLAVDHDVQLNETVLRGLTEMHVRTVLERMKDQFKLEVTTSAPSVPYRETIGAAAEGHARHKKQTGGAGQFGDCYLRVEPLMDDTDYEFVDEVVGGRIPRALIPAVDRGVRETMKEGIIAGYPLTGIRVAVYDGSYHPVDSNEMAFRQAARIGLRKACADADPVILEPMKNITVTIPESYAGAVMGDVSASRGRVTGMDTNERGDTVVQATVPYAELTDYATRLRSLSRGTGDFQMESAGYEQVPYDVQKHLIELYEEKRTK